MNIELEFEIFAEDLDFISEDTVFIIGCEISGCQEWPEVEIEFVQQIHEGRSIDLPKEHEEAVVNNIGKDLIHDEAVGQADEQAKIDEAEARADMALTRLAWYRYR